MKKKEFQDISYDRSLVCWPEGNSIVGPRVMLRIKFREQDEIEDEEERLDWIKAKEIYDKHINLGHKFSPRGKDAANHSAICKITYMNMDKEYFRWKQISPEVQDGYKAPRGKFNIGAAINLVKSGKIQFI